MVVVVRRAPWTLILLVLLLQAFTSTDAEDGLTFLGLFVALAVLGVEFRALQLDPFDVFSALKSIGREHRRRDLALAAVALAGTIAVIYALRGLLWVADWLAEHLESDADLIIAWLGCVVGLLVAWGIRALLPKWIAPGARLARSRAYWTEVRFNLVLVCVALVPAALLANWAWNVLASVVLPLFVASVRREVSEVRTDEFRDKTNIPVEHW